MTRRSAPVLVALLAFAAGCSLGQGTGEVKSDALFAHDCWGTLVDATHANGAPYDLAPDFFAANPYRTTLQITVQRGSDLTEFSDGLSVVIDDICQIRCAIGASPGDVCGTCDGQTSSGGTSDGGAGDAGSADAGSADAGSADAGASGSKWRITVPAGVHPPGAPTEPPADMISIVHMSLYLQRTCRNQNTVLNAVDGYITFSALFDGDPNETSADDKLTNATFDAQFGDLSDVPVGSYVGDVPAGLQSRVTGSFNFYFQRGQPAQPFP